MRAWRRAGGKPLLWHIGGCCEAHESCRRIGPPDRPGLLLRPAGPGGPSGPPGPGFFGKGYDRRSRRNLPVGTASTLTPGQAGDDRPRKERLMPRGRARQGKAEAFMVKSGELLGWALGGVEREIAETRKRLSTLMAQAAKLRSRLVSLKGRKTSAASPPARGSRRSRRPDVRCLEETHRGGRQARGGAQAAPQLGLSPSVFSLQSLVAKSPVGPRAWRPGSPPGARECSCRMACRHVSRSMFKTAW